MNSEQFENTSSALDHELNEALVNANIENGYEEFLGIFDRFYAEQAEVVSEGHSTGLAGKSHVLPVLFNFLLPLHVMAEIGGLPLHFGIPRFAATIVESSTRSGRSIWSESLGDALRCIGLRPGGGRARMSSTSVITNIAKSVNR